MKMPSTTLAIQSDNLLVNGYDFGAVDLNLTYDEIEGIQYLSGAFTKDSIKSMGFTGAYMPFAKNDNFKLSLEVHDFNLAHVEDYISILDTLNGDVKGNISFFGQLHQPEFRGDLSVDDLRFSIPNLNIQFQSDSSSSIYLTDRRLNLNEIQFKGVENNTSIGLGRLQGNFIHRYFKDFNLDLNLEADSLLCLNTRSHVDKAYFGRAIATGDASFKGPTNAIDIEVNAASNKGTALFIPLDDEESIDELSFIHFIDKNQQSEDIAITVTDLVATEPTFTIDMNVELNEKADVNIIFDETLGDKLRATGNGFVNIGLDEASEVYMFGDYTIEEGDYLFTLQNFVNKKFEIEKGSKLTWDGSPSDAQMNLNALYKLNTNLSLLTSDTLYNKSRDVECRMMMNGDLLKPKIDFDIQIPNGDDRALSLIITALFPMDKLVIHRLSATCFFLTYNLFIFCFGALKSRKYIRKGMFSMIVGSLMLLSSLLLLPFPSYGVFEIVYFLMAILWNGKLLVERTQAEKKIKRGSLSFTLNNFF